MEKWEDEIETRDRNKGKVKDKKENEEKDLGEGKATRQWIEEDQDGNFGLTTLALIYRYDFKVQLEVQTLLQWY